jgi:carbamoyl-phosphate synthase large subunit
MFEVRLPKLPEDEPEYLDRMLDICKRHAIDIIFPTNDVEMKIVSKYDAAFRAAGVTPIVSEFVALERAQNKFHVAMAAAKTGFPCPRTFLYESDKDALEAAEILGFPCVLKASNSQGSYGVRFIRSSAQLLTEIQDLRKLDGGLILQEYIPGNKERSLNLILDRSGRVILSFTLRKLHYLKPSFSTAVEIVESPPEMQQGVELVRHLGLYGFCAIQTKTDARDGKYKLVELNSRFGSNARILFRFGENLPLACVKLGLTEAVSLRPFALGMTGVSPFEDLLALGLFLAIKLFRESKQDALSHYSNRVPSLSDMLRSYLRLYAQGAVCDDYFASLPQDPIGTLRYYLWVIKSLFALPQHWQHFIPWGEIE